MKEIRCYQLETPDGQFESPDGQFVTRVSPELITLVPSGCEGAWLVVYEDPAYSIGVAYATEDQEELIEILLKSVEGKSTKCRAPIGTCRPADRSKLQTELFRLSVRSMKDRTK